jgi:branched-chain amino acid transport system permease protein
VLVGAAQLAFGADYRQINLPVANRIASAGPLHFSVGYILSFAVSVALVLALRQFLARTEMGRAIRAVAQNRTVAPLMGIRVERVSAITFGLGIACAGVAGALLLPIFWTNPTVGGPYTLKSFVIVVLGGMGSVQGAALGGLLLGVAEQFTAYTWADRYAEVVNFVLFLAVLLFRPQGLFGGKGT